MDHLEKVEKIREKTGVSYEDAKTALEASEYDILDAIIYLEQQGKIEAPEQESFQTSSENQQSTEFIIAQENYEKETSRKSAGDALDRFVSELKKLFKKTIDHHFVVERNEHTLITIPVLILILALCAAFWVTVPLLIIGLFFGCRYRFTGIGETKIDINQAFDKAADKCDEIKNEFTKDEN